jgi:hypothetical protein
MAGVHDLRHLLQTMQPELQPVRYVFVTVPRIPDGVVPLAMIREDEGVSLILDQADADRLGLAYDYVAAMITLRVHSSLAAVGLTAAVAGALAEGGISCNVVAGYFHDHLFVPVGDGPRAIHLLHDLSSASR